MSPSVDLTPEVLTAVQTMRDAGEVPLRCHKGPIRTAIAAAVRALRDDDLGGRVRPWDLSALRRRAAGLAALTGARALYVDDAVLIAELLPGQERVVLRGIEDGWRLVRFLERAEDPAAVSLRPEITTEVTLTGPGPDAVLSVLGVVKPDGVELDTESEGLGVDGARTVYRYLFTDGSRSVLAEETVGRLRGVLIDAGRGLLLTGDREHAVLVAG